MTPNKDTIRLTPKQKEVIRAIRKKEHVLKWCTHSVKFEFMDKTFRYDLGWGLQKFNLIEKNPLSGYINYSFTLTTLGRTINLEGGSK